MDEQAWQQRQDDGNDGMTRHRLSLFIALLSKLWLHICINSFRLQFERKSIFEAT